MFLGLLTNDRTVMWSLSFLKTMTAIMQVTSHHTSYHLFIIPPLMPLTETH